MEEGCCRKRAAAASSTRKAWKRFACGDFVSDLCGGYTQSTGNAILNSDHLGDSWDRYFAPEHTREQESGGTSVKARVVTYVGYGRKDLLPVDVETLDAAWEQVCTKSNKSGAKNFVKGNVGKVGKPEVRHGRLDVFSRQVKPGVSKGGVAVFHCGEANSDGGETEAFTRLNVAEQSVLLNVLGKTCQNGAVHVLLVAVLREETAADDRSDSTVQAEKRLSGGEDFVQNVQSGDHLPIGHDGAVLSCRRWTGAFLTNGA